MGKYSKRRRSRETNPQKLYIQKAVQDLRHIIIITIPSSTILSYDVVKRETELYSKLCQAVISQINEEEDVAVIINRIQWLIKELEKTQSKATSFNNTRFSFFQKKQLSELSNKIKEELSQIITDLSYSTDESTYSSIDPVEYENMLREMYNKASNNNHETPPNTNPDNFDNNLADTNIAYTISPFPNQETETSIKYLSPLDKICIPPFTTHIVDEFAIEIEIIDKEKKYLLGPKKKGAIIGFHTALRDNDAFLEKNIEVLNKIFGERYGVEILTLETHTKVYRHYYKATDGKIKKWLTSKNK